MRYLIGLFCSCFFVFAHGQPISFTFRDYITLPRTANFHGISGIDFIPERGEWQLAGDRGQYHTLRSIHSLSDWVCSPDSLSKTGLYLEAIRYDAPTDTYFFAVENDDESYVGFKKQSMPREGEPFERLALPHAMPAPSTNKGIEGLAITASALWVAPEAGSADEATETNKTIHFYRYKKTSGSVTFDAEFSYEIDRNLCSSETLGGVSEIIAIPGDETRLLVLERCYQKPNVTAKLYEVQIDEVNKKLIKRTDKPAFDFNNQPGFRPDNLEGMTWGESVNGKKMLYLISDDNGGKAQWTQLIVLELN